MWSARRLLLLRPLFSPCPLPIPARHFATTTPTLTDSISSDDDSTYRFLPSDDTPQEPSPGPRQFHPRPLENNLDPGIYKAILVGRVGQRPVKKTLRSGRGVVLLSLGTGGIRNNRRPFDNEEPRQYAERCAVQWHRISVYNDRYGSVILRHARPGSLLYLEGNLETKIFSDPNTGLVSRIREVAIRGNGRVIFLSNDSEAAQPEDEKLRTVGYY